VELSSFQIASIMPWLSQMFTFYSGEPRQSKSLAVGAEEIFCTL